MSADGSVTLNWAGEERRFRLAIGQLRELQENINSRRKQPIGPWSLLQLVIHFDVWPDDLRDIFRLGLLGGGTKSELVPGLIKRYVDERPLVESCYPASLILGAALTGAPDDPVGKKPDEDASMATTTFSNSPISTDQAPQSGSPLDKSMTARSGNSQHVSRDTIEQTVPTRNNPQ